MNLIGKVALITGAAMRVGRAIAWELAQAGCDVIITYCDSRADAETLVRKITALGRRAWTVRADLMDKDVAETLSQFVRREVGRLDILIHNASVYQSTRWGELTTDAWHQHMRVNAEAPVMITQRLHDLLQADEGGRVVHLVDIHVMGRPRRHYVAYNASKAALLEMTYTLARELAPKVTVNAVAPGVVAWHEGAGEEEKQAYLRRVPLGRSGTPADAAKAVLYLVRDADYLTGQIIRVDGGRWLG